MAHLIDKKSMFVGKEELNLFSLPATQIAAERSKFHTIYPKTAVAQTEINSPITFEISGLPDFLDLSKNFLKIKFQIKKADLANIDADADVAPINYLSNTFINQMKIYLNNKLVSDSTDTYMYRSYIETLVNFSTDVKNTRLQLAGWYQDEIAAGTTTTDNHQNPGFIKRKALAQNSQTFELLAPLHSDIFNQSAYLLPNVNLRVELLRNKHNAVITKYNEPAGGPIIYHLYIKNIEWNVRVVEINKSLALSIEKTLLKNTAKYPIKRTIVRTYQLTQNTRDVRNFEVYNGQLPTGMLVTFLNSNAFHGDGTHYPFNFQPYNIESSQAIVGGRRWPMEKPLEMNFAINHITEAYFQFLNNSGFLNSFQESNGITLDMYKKHCFFLSFDFRNDEKDDDNAFDLIKHGETRIFLRFRNALTENIHLIAYLSFDNILRIDSGRNAIMDYSM